MTDIEFPASSCNTRVNMQKYSWWRIVSAFQNAKRNIKDRGGGYTGFHFMLSFPDGFTKCRKTLLYETIKYETTDFIFSLEKSNRVRCFMKCFLSFCITCVLCLVKYTAQQFNNNSKCCTSSIYIIKFLNYFGIQTSSTFRNFLVSSLFYIHPHAPWSYSAQLGKIIIIMHILNTWYYFHALKQIWTNKLNSAGF